MQPEKDPWQLYKEALVNRNSESGFALKRHLCKLMRTLDANGKQDMLVKLVIPVLEHSLPLNNDMTLWSMKSFIFLFPSCSIDANQYKKKFYTISSVLMSQCLTGFDSDLGFTAFHCLKLMALSELSRRADQFSVEDTLPTSDEDACNDSDEVRSNTHVFVTESERSAP